jgi:hypothetical protein
MLRQELPTLTSRTTQLLVCGDPSHELFHGFTLAYNTFVLRGAELTDPSNSYFVCNKKFNSVALKPLQLRIYEVSWLSPDYTNLFRLIFLSTSSNPFMRDILNGPRPLHSVSYTSIRTVSYYAIHNNHSYSQVKRLCNPRLLSSGMWRRVVRSILNNTTVGPQHWKSCVFYLVRAEML